MMMARVWMLHDASEFSLILNDVHKIILQRVLFSLWTHEPTDEAWKEKSTLKPSKDVSGLLK